MRLLELVSYDRGHDVAVSTQVTIQYVDGCPSWVGAVERVQEAARQVRASIDVKLEKVENVVDAERLQFIGSPTILVEGTDPFGRPGAPPAFACRTPEGSSGCPTVAQLVGVLAGRLGAP